MDKWNDEEWNSTIKSAIGWYVWANMCSGGVEGGIVLLQAAFERIASYPGAERERSHGLAGELNFAAS
jgi:hypothetical protein